jgi:hypothetical protein
VLPNQLIVLENVYALIQRELQGSFLIQVQVVIGERHHIDEQKLAKSHPRRGMTSHPAHL